MSTTNASNFPAMWENDKSIIVSYYNETINANNLLLFNIIRDHLEEFKPVYPLVEFILCRIETIFELIQHDKLWDAEIILRAIIESFVKFSYISFASNDEKNIRLNEFWNELEEINLLKISDQAKLNLKYTQDSEIHKISYSPLIMPEDIENKLREKWPRKKRQEIESKWSFTNIVKEISAKFKGTPLEIWELATHSYRICSHIAHGDETGLAIIAERNSRTQDEQNRAFCGHFIRLVDDCLCYAVMTGLSSMDFLNLKDKRGLFKDLMKKDEQINEIIEKYINKVFEDVDYDKYRSRPA